MRIIRHNVEPFFKLSLQTFHVVDDDVTHNFQHPSQINGANHIDGHRSPSSAASVHGWTWLHRGQYEHINNSLRTSIRHNTSSHRRNVLSIEGTSSSSSTFHTEDLDESVRLQEHSTPGRGMSWAFVQGHVHTRTRKYSDQPLFITPADLTLAVSVLWVALVAHVSMYSAAFRRRVFGFSSKRR